jgi:hypothetical protein
MDKFSNGDIQRITGLSHRQIIYLAEKKIVEPEIEGASGRGSTRWYSRRNLAQVLLTQCLRDAGMMDFPGLRAVSAVVGGFFDQLDKILAGPSPRVPTILHLIDGHYGWLSTRDGGGRTKVFQFDQEGRTESTSEKPDRLEDQATVHVTVDLEKVVQKLKGE